MKTSALSLFVVSAALLAGYQSGEAQLSPPATQSQAPVPQAPPTMTAPQGSVSNSSGSVDIANEPIVKIVANVQPAVVNITAEQTVPEYVTYMQHFQMYRRIQNQTEQSIGSGLIISADGYILTNAHVVALAESGKEVTVTLSTGSKYRAQIVAADDDADLALLKIEDQTTQFPYFDLTYTSPNLLGETVVALGSPAGYQNSVSHGILSALHRTFTVKDDNGNEHTYNNVIQTDAAINPGNSGGPLVDLNGGLVGIDTAKLSGEAIEGIGFAIPSDVVIPWANDAMAVAKGQKTASVSTTQQKLNVLKQALGLTVKTLSTDEASQRRLNGGLLITDVEDGSPAGDAGLRPDMVVVRVFSRPVTDARSLPHELLAVQSGTPIRLGVIFQQSVGPMTIQRGGSVLLTAR